MVIKLNFKGSSNLKGFIVLSIILHMAFLFFMPGSIFHSQVEMAEPPEPLDFFMVDYLPVQEEPVEEPAETEPVPEPEPDLDPEPEVEDIEEELEEPPLEDPEEEPGPEEVEKEIEEELEEPDVEEIEEELVLEETEEKAVAEEMLDEEVDAPPLEEDISIALEVEEDPIMASDLSDEYVYLDSMMPPSSEDLEEALKPEEEQIEEEREPEEPEEPQLPQDPTEALLSRTDPVMPKDVANEGIEGTVELMLLIGGDGSLKEIEFLEVSGDDRIDDNARMTIERMWNFTEQPGDYYIHLIIEYKLPEPQPHFVDIFFAEEGE